MGNAVATGVPTPNSPSPLLRLRRGKKSVGCPCYLADEASTWESITENPKFRSYVLRHLLDEGFISSILEYGEREHALTACGGVPYYEVSVYNAAPVGDETFTSAFAPPAVQPPCVCKPVTDASRRAHHLRIAVSDCHSQDC